MSNFKFELGEKVKFNFPEESDKEHTGAVVWRRDDFRQHVQNDYGVLIVKERLTYVFGESELERVEDGK